MNNMDKTIKLSGRLAAVASFAETGCRVADIGTDHGYIPIYLVQTGRAESALAMDVRKGPLDRARAHIEALDPQQRARLTTRLSDGLKALKPGEADTVVIAGMGGELMIRILTEGSHMWDSVTNWILSPQSELQKVRHFFKDQGFFICRETMVKDEGKYYTVMQVRRGAMEELSEAAYLYGPCLLEQKSPVLAEYLGREEIRVLGILRQVEAGIEGQEAGSEGQEAGSEGQESGSEGHKAGSRKARTEGRIKAAAALSLELKLIKEAQYEMQ